jgi:wyosine [tRNA(Phe)-imidazoG37] synthetase (radical SAM superfamily)
VDRTFHQLRFKDIVNGLKEFRKSFNGKLALQVMLIAQNKAFANEVARIAKTINPDEVQLDTPLRPSAAKPLTASEMKNLVVHFKEMNVVNVYDKKRKTIQALDPHATVKRHGQYHNSSKNLKNILPG